MDATPVGKSPGFREAVAVRITLFQKAGTPGVIVGFYIVLDRILICPRNGGADLDGQAYRAKGIVGDGYGCPANDWDLRAIPAAGFCPAGSQREQEHKDEQGLYFHGYLLIENCSKRGILVAQLS
jgi:hypothetical protein